MVSEFGKRCCEAVPLRPFTRCVWMETILPLERKAESPEVRLPIEVTGRTVSTKTSWVLVQRSINPQTLPASPEQGAEAAGCARPTCAPHPGAQLSPPSFSGGSCAGGGQGESGDMKPSDKSDHSGSFLPSRGS